MVAHAGSKALSGSGLWLRERLAPNHDHGVFSDYWKLSHSATLPRSPLRPALPLAGSCRRNACSETRPPPRAISRREFCAACVTALYGQFPPRSQDNMKRLAASVRTHQRDRAVQGLVGAKHRVNPPPWQEHWLHPERA